jgi:hypothetical protein
MASVVKLRGYVVATRAKARHLCYRIILAGLKTRFPGLKYSKGAFLNCLIPLPSGSSFNWKNCE